MKSPLFSISITFLIGIIVCTFSVSKYIPILLIFISALIALILFAMFFKNKIISHIFLYLLIFFSGFIRFASFNELPQNHIKFIIDEKPKRIFLKGIVSNEPIFRRRFGYYPELEYLLKINAAKYSNNSIDIEGLVLVKQYYSGKEIIEYGDELLLEGKLFSPTESTKRGGFNYRKYLARKKIYAVFRVDKNNYFKKLDRSSTPLINIKRHLYSIKNRARKSILINLSPPHSSILAAMILGDRQYLDKSTKDIFMRTGTMHILAISGLHVGIVVFIFLGLFKAVKIPRNLAYVFTIIIIVLYALMVGQRASIWRATIMASIFLLGFVLNKQSDLLNILSLAFLILIFINPNYIFDVGFILSFTCIISIIWLTPIFDKLFRINDLKSKIPYYLLKSLSVSISIWIGILPIIAYFFRVITPITIFANLIVIPICFVLVSLGISALLFNLFSYKISVIFYETIWLTDNVLILFLKSILRLPLAFIKISNFDIFYIFIYYAALFYLVMKFISKAKNKSVKNTIVTFL